MRLTPQSGISSVGVNNVSASHNVSQSRDGPFGPPSHKEDSPQHNSAQKVYVCNSLLPTPESVIFVTTPLPGQEVSLFVFVTHSGTVCSDQPDPLHLDPVQ